MDFSLPDSQIIRHCQVDSVFLLALVASSVFEFLTNRDVLVVILTVPVPLSRNKLCWNLGGPIHGGL